LTRGGLVIQAMWRLALLVPLVVFAGCDSGPTPKVELRPDDPQIQNALGFTLADHKQQLPRAEQLIRSALAVSPDSPAIQDSLGWVLFQRGQTKTAVPVLARAWQNSGDSEIASHYGEALWRSGDQAHARYIWQMALNSTPDHDHLRATMKRLTGEDVVSP